MAVAGSWAFRSLHVSLRRELGPKWSSCSSGRVVCDVNCSKFAVIPRNHRVWKLPFSPLASASTSRRRLVSSPKVTTREDSQVVDTEDDKEGAEELSTSEGEDQEGKEQAEGWDLSWIPSIRDVLTACVANYLFGYHIGIINGPLDSIARELNFEGNTLVEGFVVGVFLVGAFFGSISGGVLSDSIGRRRTFQLCATPLVLGTALSATADSVEIMVLGRLMVGLGIGVNTSLVPLYISEIAPTKFRGTLGSLCQVGTCTGIITVLLLGLPAGTDPHWWRTMFWLGTLPALLLIFGMEFCAESPRWLGKVGRWDEASSTFEKLWGKDQVEPAMVALRNANSAQEEEASWGELFTPRYRRVATIGAVLFILQQYSGINGIIYFSSSSFQNAGITDNIAASALVGVLNLAGAVAGASMMDLQGRRNLLMASYGGMAGAVAIMVTALNVPMDEQLSHGLMVTGTLAYVFTFGLGAGPVMACIIPEMCSTRIRAKVMAFSLCVHWVCNFSIAFLFLEVVQRVGLSAVYTSFGVVSLLAVLFTNSYIIETKGRSLEEIEILLSSKSEAS